MKGKPAAAATDRAKMLKWIKVRQDAAATPTPADREKKDEPAKVEVEDVAAEEEEDSGMEREDTPSNIELSDLRKVCRIV